MFDGGWNPIEYSEEKERRFAKEEAEYRRRLQNELGLTESEYYSAAAEEYERLKSEEPDSGRDELLNKAFEIVEEHHKKRVQKKIDAEAGYCRCCFNPPEFYQKLTAECLACISQICW